jgi:hypothetical protein
LGGHTSPGGVIVKNPKRLLALSILLAAGLVQAQTSTTKVETPQNEASVETRSESTLEKVFENKKYEDNHQITDSKMRADVGSMSRYSFKFDFRYMGSAIETPFGKERPNPDHVYRPNATQLGGFFTGRYRLDSSSSMGMGTGINALHPFHGTDRMDVSTPYLSYDLFSRHDDFQLRNTFLGNYETVPTYKDIGIVGGFNYIFSIVRELGTSGFAAGVDTTLYYKFFGREYREKDGWDSVRYTVGLSPSLKYNFSDRINTYTNLMIIYSNPRRLDNSFAIWTQTITQNFGMGYAFTKDVYFAPYISVFPNKLAWNNTSVNFSTTFSVL